MAIESPHVPLKVLFVRAFLAELRRGNRDGATLFARAFLAEHVARNFAPENGLPA